MLSLTQRESTTKPKVVVTADSGLLYEMCRQISCSNRVHREILDIHPHIHCVCVDDASQAIRGQKRLNSWLRDWRNLDQEGVFLMICLYPVSQRMKML